MGAVPPLNGPSMPTPIQSSSITAKLRSFFRLRGRQIFTLDETTVPMVTVEDLTGAPYRGNHQVRFKVGQRFNPAILVGRRFMFIVNMSEAAFMNVADVPGVAVIERLTLQYMGGALPDGTRDWTASLVNHQGILNSVEPGAAITLIAADVDSAFATPVPALGIAGQTPIRLTGVQQNVAPSLGTLLRLGRFKVANELPGTVFECMPAEQVTIGDNVALLILNEVAATGGVISLNVSGSYYPLARS